MILLLIEVHWEDIPEEKTNVFIKSPHLKPSGKEFKEAKLSNCFSADSLPVESAKCLRLGDHQTEFKMSTKPLLKFYCALSTGKESAETELLNWLLWNPFQLGSNVDFLGKHSFFFWNVFSWNTVQGEQNPMSVLFPGEERLLDRVSSTQNNVLLNRFWLFK